MGMESIFLGAEAGLIGLLNAGVFDKDKKSIDKGKIINKELYKVIGSADNVARERGIKASIRAPERMVTGKVLEADAENGNRVRYFVENEGGVDLRIMTLIANTGNVETPELVLALNKFGNFSWLMSNALAGDKDMKREVSKNGKEKTERGMVGSGFSGDMSETMASVITHYLGKIK